MSTIRAATQELSTSRLLLPETLKDTGSLLLTNQLNLDQLRDVHDYPLARLAFAIRHTAEEHNWEVMDITALLRQSEATDRGLTQDEVEGMASGLLVRLLDCLPDDGQPEQPDTLNDSQQDECFVKAKTRG